MLNHVHNTAMHPCGVILSNDTLLQRTPVVPTSQEGFPATQFDKEDVEIDGLGLLKLDVLGVRMQSSMAYAVREIERTTGLRIDLDDRQQVRLDDPKAFELLREGESLGVFQLESPGQHDLLGRLQPETFADLVAEISLFRPGPVQADMIKPFLLGRHGKRPVTYPHPDLEPWLRSTYGVIIFNEQVAGVFSAMTRTDLAMGEEARRALAKPERLPALQAWYRERAGRAGFGPEVVDRVWKMLENMGAYGFARAHGVAFALPTLQSAWLKAHYPAAFYAGLLEHDPGMYPKRLVLADARRRGVPILPPDVQRSDAHYRTETTDDGRLAVRVALADVHGITDDQAQRTATGRLLHERAQGTDPRRVTPAGPPATVAVTRRYDTDVLNPDTTRQGLLALATDLGARLRTADQSARHLELTVTYADRSTTTRSRTLHEPTHHTPALRDTLYAIHTALGLQRARIRALTVRAGHLTPATHAYTQLTLDPATEDQRRLEPVLDKANNRWGTGTLRPAALATPRAVAQAPPRSTPIR
ncbi:hypothetical protein [Kitasatospora sp. NPDC057936]|uniref:DinB/UmuC family translesion DNA polymerase n=1 Tax=Kitasatospora sp. NPDC057936 TaxID=3346283 RepID=UPI0036D8BE06